MSPITTAPPDGPEARTADLQERFALDAERDELLTDDASDFINELHDTLVDIMTPEVRW